MSKRKIKYNGWFLNKNWLVLIQTEKKLLPRFQLEKYILFQIVLTMKPLKKTHNKKILFGFARYKKIRELMLWKK